MTLSRFQSIALSISGVTAIGIGAFILAAPHAFYASYGISLGNDIDLLSELRAPAAALATFGAIMLAGIKREALSPTSMVVALTVFLAFPAGRIIGLLVDGVPSGSVIGALAIELVIAALCIIAFGRRLWGATPLSNGNLSNTA